MSRTARAGRQDLSVDDGRMLFSGTGEVERAAANQMVGNAAGSGREGEITLALGDLVQDANGEVVLFNDSNLRVLAITADARLVRQGQVQHHVTATGEDVTGFRFMTFDNGLTLYYQPDLEVIVRHGAS